MSEQERLIALAGGLVATIGVTAVVCWLALTATDDGTRQLLIGALVGTGAFGGGALFTMLGMHRRQPPGSGASVNVAPEPPSTIEINTQGTSGASGGGNV